jgi:hypothetical protein
MALIDALNAYQKLRDDWLKLFISQLVNHQANLNMAWLGLA